MPTEWDVIIVGAGIAGSALAAYLGAHGRRVLLLDRHAEPPETIAGELLQPGGVHALERLGLEDCLAGIEAQPVWGFGVIDGERQLKLSYPQRTLANGDTEQEQGYSFRQHRLVRRLREASLRHPTVEFLQENVRELWESNGRILGVELGDGVRMGAPLTVLASGRNAKISAGLRRTHLPYRVSYSVGISLRETTLPYPHHGHVFLTTPSPTLGYQISNQVVRLLVDFPGELPKRGTGALFETLRTQLCPQLPQALHAPFEAALAREEVQSMQSVALLPERPQRDGVVWIGDALSMRHPLTGGGMTVALNDVAVLGEALLTQPTHTQQDIDLLLQRFYREREPMAATIDMLSGALYEIFKAEQSGLTLLREAVLRYWQLGGLAVSGPMSLLAGLRPSPTQLFLHYCAVALLGAGSHISPLSWGQTLHARWPRLDDIKEGSQLLKAAADTLGHQLQRGLKLFRL